MKRKVLLILSSMILVLALAGGLWQPRHTRTGRRTRRPLLKNRPLPIQNQNQSKSRNQNHGRARQKSRWTSQKKNRWMNRKRKNPWKSLKMEEEAEEMDMGMLATPKFEFNDCDESYEGETIVIYQQAGLTGPLAQILGDGFINGTNDAIAAINADGGICGAMLEAVLEDTQYDPPQEIATYERFRAATARPMFILTYGSGATIVLKDRVIEDEIVNIAAGLDANSFYIPRDGWTVGCGPRLLRPVRWFPGMGTGQLGRHQA
jgi:hypothetical protein